MGACCGGAQSGKTQNLKTVTLTSKNQPEIPNSQIVQPPPLQQTPNPQNQLPSVNHSDQQIKEPSPIKENEKQLNDGQIEQNNLLVSQEMESKKISITLLYGKQVQILKAIEQDQTVNSFKQYIFRLLKDEIKKTLKLDKNDDFYLYHNKEYLKPDKQLLDYNLFDEEIRIYGLITIKVIGDQKNSWGKKVFLNSTWQQLKEKMAAELSIEPSKIQFKYQGELITDELLQLHENNIVDQDEVELLTK